MERITTETYDIAGAEVPRVAKHAFLSLFAKYEDFSGGPGFRQLFAAYAAHYLGGILAYCLVRFEQRSVRVLDYVRHRMKRGK